MFRALLATEFSPYGRLSEDQLDRLEQHYNLLTRWNRKLNLTRLGTLNAAVSLHYCESLFLGKVLPAKPLRIVDVGSGAGFPGIPVAILRPNCEVDLTESHQRKAVFLVEASRGLPNVRVLAKRAETLESRYDWAIARAVRPEKILSLGLAPNVALLVSEKDTASLSGIVLKIPWGSHRTLVEFHVERDKI